MKVDILSREYPPRVYGGAGGACRRAFKVLAERVDVTVPRIRQAARAPTFPRFPEPTRKGRSRSSATTCRKSEDANGALKTFGVDLQIANDVDADIIHAHTGTHALPAISPKCCMTPPLVITAHSA